MPSWLLAVAAGLIVALIQYGWRDLRAGGLRALAAALRVIAVTLIAALLLDAPAARAGAIPVWAALDASISMTRGDTTVWRAARDTVRAIRAESVFVFGDSVRRGDTLSAPHDVSSFIGPLAQRALGSGHPLTVVTDGELDDPEAAQSLPAGSRLIVLPHGSRRDLAVVSMEGPRAVVSGDTVSVRVNVVAGSGGAGGGTISLALDGRPIGEAKVDSLPAFAERAVDLKLKLDGPAGPAVLRAVVSSPRDAEPRNDTLYTPIDLSRAAAAVFVSTSPDFDARYSLSVLRGALGIPTRGYYRVAPGAWRLEGPLTPVAESDVKQALHDAPVAIIHGDTSVFGPPRAATLGPLALVVTSNTEGEWYPSAAPASPLAPELSGLAWDSLPPVGAASTPPKGTWIGLEAHRGRSQETRALIVGTDEPRRVVIVAASDLWRWAFRGGVAADAFSAVWGSIFDWLAAQRADRRAAVPDERLVRAGDPVRWRRGSPSDSVVAVTLRRRGTTRADSLTLRFGPDASVVESAPLPAGLYDVTTRGGAALLAVNVSREWLPRAPRVRRGAIGGARATGSAPRLRDMGWVYALAILLLCAEWLVRRRTGMR